MSESYRRCRYISPDQVECGTFFPSSSVQDLINASNDLQYFCPVHRDGISTSNAASNGLNKETYIERRKEQEKLCHEMTLAEVDAHIAKIELVIEAEKMKVLTARAVRSQKEDALTDEQRAERRKIKTPRSSSYTTSADPTKVAAKKEKTSKSDFQKAVDSANAVRVAAGKNPMTDVQVAAFKITMGF